MRPPRFAPIVLCLTVLSLAGCGSSASLLDGRSAEDLEASVAQIQKAVAEGRCSEASSAVSEGLNRVQALPSSVDRRLVARIREGFEELEAKIPTDCAAPTTTTTPPPVTTTETEPPVTTETTPPSTETTPPTTETTPPSTETTPTTPPGDEPTEPDDGDSGGVTPDDVDGPSATPRSFRELEQVGRDMRERAERALREARRAIRGES